MARSTHHWAQVSLSEATQNVQHEKIIRLKHLIEQVLHPVGHTELAGNVKYVEEERGNFEKCRCGYHDGDVPLVLGTGNWLSALQNVLLP